MVSAQLTALQAETTWSTQFSIAYAVITQLDCNRFKLYEQLVKYRKMMFPPCKIKLVFNLVHMDLIESLVQINFHQIKPPEVDNEQQLSLAEK